MLKIPRLMDARNILVVMPHPDDAELAAGGTIALLGEKGAQVTYCIATDGSMGSMDPQATKDSVATTRQKEQMEAAAALGVTDVRWLGFPDGFMPDVSTVRRHIVDIIRDVRPSLVLTLDPWLTYESHPDHKTTALAAVEAIMYAGFPLAYPGRPPHSVSGIALAVSPYPNTYVDVSATWEKKIRACLAHASQFPPPMWHGLYGPYIEGKAKAAGEKIGSRYAEDFKVLAPHHLHMMTEAKGL